MFGKWVPCQLEMSKSNTLISLCLINRRVYCHWDLATDVFTRGEKRKKKHLYGPHLKAGKKVDILLHDSVHIFLQDGGFELLVHFVL